MNDYAQADFRPWLVRATEDLPPINFRPDLSPEKTAQFRADWLWLSLHQTRLIRLTHKPVYGSLWRWLTRRPRYWRVTYELESTS